MNGGESVVERYEQARIKGQFTELRFSSRIQKAERLASHYLMAQSHAVDLRELLNARRICPPDKLAEVDAAIDYLTKILKTAHAHDFGIVLEWPPVT